MRLRRAALLLVATAAPLAWPATAPPPAQAAGRDATSAGTQTLTVADAAEAWFAASPIDVCTTPLGCPPQQVPTSPYPADTLHVGAAGGQESARTYLQPDLSLLPFDATLVGGVMTLPVDANNGDGTLSPDTAKIRACLVTKPVPDGTQGSSSTPPSTDCTVAASPAYDATRGVFTLDLQPFVDAWAAGAARDGIALLPDSNGAGPTDAWHVTFFGRKNANGHHISSEIVVRPAPSQPDTQVVVPSAPVPAAPAAPPPTLTAPSAVVPAAPPVVAAPAGQPVAVPAQPVALSRQYQYPLAFLLPLALLAAAVFFVRLFTRDLTPTRSRA